MGFLKKIFGSDKVETSNEVPQSIPSSWSILPGKSEGNAMLTRKNDACEQFIGNSNFSLRCGIAFHILHPDENGFPDVMKEPELDQLEDVIFQEFESNVDAIIPVVITTSGFREYVLYSKSEDIFISKLSEIQKQFPQYQLTHFSIPDPKWKYFKSV
jgi:hypothetical protein